MSTNTAWRSSQWDPVLILSQIVCLQSLWYLSISVILYIFSAFSGEDMTLDSILKYQEIRADNAGSLLLALAWLLNAAVGIFLLLRIVGRARLVLDFSVTLLIYHFMMTTYYSNAMPTTFLWWTLNGTTCAIMVFGGEYVCMQLEMEPIILGGGGGATSATSGNNTNSATNNLNNNAGSGVGPSSNNGSQGGQNEESAMLLMETLEADHIDLPNTARLQPGNRTKARTSEDAGVGRSIGSFTPALRNSILGKPIGRQRTSDRYEMVPVTDPSSSSRE